MKRLTVSLLALILLAGCASPAPEPAPEPEPLSPVYTDWSKLTPYEPAKEQYAYADTYREDGALRPSGDYGFLLPYIGSYLETESYMGPLTTLGLVTVDGRLVTPPVYAEIEMARDWLTNAYAPFLLLYRGEVTARHENEWGSWAEGDFNLTVASPDGSWVRELPPCYGGGQLLSGDRLALALTDGSVLILNPDGSTAMTFPASALEPYLGEGFTWQWDGGPSLDWVDDVGRVWKYDENDPEGSRYACWLNPDTGAVTMDPPPSFVEPEYEYQEGPELAFPGYNDWDTLTDPVTGKLYCSGARTDGSGIRDLLDEQGQVILEDCELSYWVMGIEHGWQSPWVWADRISCSEVGVFCYYDLGGNCVFRRTIQTNLD